MRPLIYSRTARATALLALTLLVGCEPDDVGTMIPDPGFQGDAGHDADTGPVDPTSGLSECSLFDENGCGAAQACAPTAAGTRRCVDNAVLLVGQACESDVYVCVAGSLCYRGAGASKCVELCDLQDPQCASGTCVAWLDIDGERAGRCLASGE